MSKERQTDRDQKQATYQIRAAEYTGANQAPLLQQAKLPSSKQFVASHERVLRSLQTALDSNPKPIRSFFEHFPFISPDNQRSSIHFINSLKDKSLRTSLREYVRFALRFSVRFTFNAQVPYFRAESVRLSGTKFWGTFHNGVLSPASASQENPPDIADFYHKNLELPAESALFDSGKAKYFVIDDHAGDSHLADIVNIAYDPDSIVFVAHHSRRQPFLFCLVGENLTDEDWRKAAVIKAAFQRKQYGTSTRGRKPNLDQRGKEYRALQSKAANKNIAIELTAASEGPRFQKAFTAKLRALSRRKLELKEQN